jgi:hypothetical protein
MRRFLFACFAFLLGFAALFFAEWEVSENSPFDQVHCYQGDEQSGNEKQAAENFVSFSAPWSGSINVGCAALAKITSAADKYHDVINALATILVAVFTFTLWRSTSKLWDASERQLSHLVKEAGRQASDMRESIVAAQESAKAAMLALGADRAWVTLEKPILNQATSGEYMGKKFNRALVFSVEWQNRGKSPALKVVPGLTCKVVPFLAQPPHFEMDWKESDEVGKSKASAPVGQNGTFMTVENAIVDEEYDAVFQKKSAIILYTAVRYRDTFQKDVVRETEVCLRIAYNGTYEAPYPGAPTKIKWDIGAVGPQNGAT